MSINLLLNNNFKCSSHQVPDNFKVCTETELFPCFKDIERFLSYWKSNPYGMALFVGKAMAHVGHRNLYDSFFAFGIAYLASLSICSRIDYLYDLYDGFVDKKVYEQFEIEMREEVLCLKDIDGEYKLMHMMVARDQLNNAKTYVLRFFIDEDEEPHPYLDSIWQDSEIPTFSKVLAKLTHSNSDQLYGEDQRFWSFQCAKDMIDGVIVFPETYGFYDLWTTKSAADMIVLASDSSGYC